MKINMKKNNRLIITILVLILISSNLYQSTVISAKADRKAPTAPTNLKATTITDTSVTLSWNASTDNVGVKSYNIYKGSTLLANTSANTYTASGLLPGKTYSFYVKALDAASNMSSSSNTVTITTNSATSPTITPTITPTMTPTVTPSAAPTVSPTVTPTVSPTVAPTITPTLAPTPTPTPSTNTNKVVGYYAAWAAYSGYTPDKIAVNKLTHINYAFANIGSDLKIALGYPDVDPSNISKLNALKKVNPNLKTIISVGGWSWSSRFSDVALTNESRTTFANSCVDFLVSYGFDGVDIDWEYPVSGGLSTNVHRAEDKTNFTLLMQTLREKLDARGAIDGKHYILTFAGAGSNSYLNNIETQKLEQYVDYVNIMTYDMHGSWDVYTDLTSPLYTNHDTSPQYKASVDESINLWINTGFSTKKIVMGVPFYGYLYKSVTNQNNGLYQTYSGSSSISYANIAGNYLNNVNFKRYFHSESMVPWLFDGSTFISYEDQESIAMKANYITSKGLGGAMIWELSQDPSGVLLDTLYTKLN